MRFGRGVRTSVLAVAIVASMAVLNGQGRGKVAGAPAASRLSIVQLAENPVVGYTGDIAG